MKLRWLHLILFQATVTLHALEDLEAPPVTTCRAWAIADAVSGQMIASEKGDEGQKSASTTKVMCALVVLNLAEGDASLLDQKINVSKLADATPGSTAEVKAGEKLTVREALYGLLLPSGNDLGNALAEHFNARLAPPGDESPAKLAEPAYASRRNFVAEMNRTAARLGMTKTRYFIPYGDGGTPEARTTTAHDLIRLARAAMERPLLREIVQTRKHDGTVITPKGESRTVTWTNTNKLLDLGYTGIKTGMTPTAGHCLVALGEKDGRGLLVVVLGASSDESRYADTRNLFRWAWARR
jgi:serine-type D-Ala-D-Ala carboxypeptidase (penicillin-binding protein 5/6)